MPCRPLSRNQHVERRNKIIELCPKSTVYHLGIRLNDALILFQSLLLSYLPEKFLSTWECLEKFPFFLSREFLKISVLFQYFSTQIGSINKTYYIGHGMVILGSSDVHFSSHDSLSHSSCLPCLLNIGFLFVCLFKVRLILVGFIGEP